MNWKSKIVGNTLELSHVSPDKDEGYPGTLSITVTYELNEDNELVISYHATTDKATIINVTNHSYFNLAGEVRSSLCNTSMCCLPICCAGLITQGSGDILGHELQSPCAFYTPVGPDLIPTGEIATVKVCAAPPRV